MDPYLKRKKEIENKYKVHLDNLKRELRKLEDEIESELLKIDQEKILNETIKFKGLSILEILHRYSEIWINNTNLNPKSSTFVDDWYNKIKELYPSYDISKDIVECKEERFGGDTYYTFSINNVPFYQLCFCLRGGSYYSISENIGNNIIKNINDQTEKIRKEESCRTNQEIRERQIYKQIYSSRIF